MVVDTPEPRIAASTSWPVGLIAAAIITIIGLQAMLTVMTSPQMQWPVIAQYVFAPIIVIGVATTIVITFGAWLIGLCGGLLIVFLRSSRIRLLRIISVSYVSILRSIPLLVQILFWYNLATFIPTISLGMPRWHLGFSIPTNTLLPPLAACLIALGLNQAAYMSEIIRSGLLGVQAGQREAARALGMTNAKSFRRVVAPQAIRIVLPSIGNDAVSLMKATSLVSVVGVGDLMTRAQSIYSVNYQVIPLLMVASLWYLALTTIMVGLQFWLETKLSRGFRPIDEKRSLPRSQ